MDLIREWFFNWVVSLSVFTKLAMVCMFSVSLAVASLGGSSDTSTPNHGPVPEPEIEAPSAEKKEKKRHVNKKKSRVRPPVAAQVDQQKIQWQIQWQQKIQWQLQCVRDRQVAQNRYNEITKNAHFEDIDTDAAVDAWKAWSAVELRCADDS
jgi:hypothetical protein